MIVEKNGCTAKWDLFSDALKSTDLVVEIELLNVELLDRIDLSLGLASALVPLLHREDFQLMLTLEIMNMSTGWTKSLDRLNLLPYITDAHHGETPEEESGFVEQYKLPINIRTWAHHMKLTLHCFLNTEAASVAQPILRNVGASLYGLRTVSSNSQDTSRRFALLDSTDFHLEVLESLYTETLPTELRDACLELVYNIWKRRSDIQYAISRFQHHQFLLSNLIRARGKTASLSIQLLFNACQNSKVFKVIILPHPVR